MPSAPPSHRDLARLLARLEQLAPLSPPLRAALTGIVTPRDFAAGDWLLRAGERATHCYFVADGLVRELYIDERGNEHTRTFVAAGGLTGSLLDLLAPAPSVTWIQALQPTHTLAWRYADLDALTTRHPELNLLMRRVAELLYVRKARREHELLALPAAERHARWLAEHAAVDAVVSRRQLASYLGVTPEHLSRLRRAASRTPARTKAGPRRNR